MRAEQLARSRAPTARRAAPAGRARGRAASGGEATDRCASPAAIRPRPARRAPRGRRCTRRASSGPRMRTRAPGRPARRQVRSAIAACEQVGVIAGTDRKVVALPGDLGERLGKLLAVALRERGLRPGVVARQDAQRVAHAAPRWRRRLARASPLRAARARCRAAPTSACAASRSASLSLLRGSDAVQLGRRAEASPAHARGPRCRGADAGRAGSRAPAPRSRRHARPPRRRAGSADA